MKLADWARQQGIGYKTAHTWFQKGLLPVPAQQLPSGTILVDISTAAGTAQVATNLEVSPENVDGVVEAATSLKIDLVVVGPEQPLADGIVDRLASLGIPAFGPTRAAADAEAISRALPGRGHGALRGSPHAQPRRVRALY